METKFALFDDVILRYVPRPFTLELDIMCSVHTSFTHCCSAEARPNIQFINIVLGYWKNQHVKPLFQLNTYHWGRNFNEMNNETIDLLNNNQSNSVSAVRDNQTLISASAKKDEKRWKCIEHRQTHLNIPYIVILVAFRSFLEIKIWDM